MRGNPGVSPSYHTWLLWRPLWQQLRQQGRLLGERGSVRGSDGLQWPRQCLLASTTAGIPEHPLESSSPGTRPGTPTPGTPTPGTPTPGTPTPGTPTPGMPTPGTPAPGTPAPVTPTLVTPTLSTPAPGRCPAPAERTRDASEPHAPAICNTSPSFHPSTKDEGLSPNAAAFAAAFAAAAAAGPPTVGTEGRASGGAERPAPRCPLVSPAPSLTSDTRHHARDTSHARDTRHTGDTSNAGHTGHATNARNTNTRNANAGSCRQREERIWSG